MSHIILYFLIDQSLHEDNAIATPPAVQEASDRSSLHLSSSLHILNRYMLSLASYHLAYAVN